MLAYSYYHSLSVWQQLFNGNPVLNRSGGVSCEKKYTLTFHFDLNSGHPGIASTSECSSRKRRSKAEREDDDETQV